MENTPYNVNKGYAIKGPVGFEYPPLQLEERFNVPEKIIFSTQDLVEFAEGEIGKVFGEQYNIIDSYSRRVRLPTTDYLLVTRVSDLDAKVNEYKKSYMATEYDIPIDAPFLIPHPPHHLHDQWGKGVVVKKNITVNFHC